MPQLVNYLSRFPAARFYDDAEMAQLQTVYDRALQQLTIKPSDSRRETLAALIFHESDDMADLDELLRRVVKRFRQCL